MNADLLERLAELVELGHSASPGFIRQVAEDAIAALSRAPGATAQDGAVVDRPLNTTDVVDHETASDVTQAPPTIPAGMVAVPVEPTEAMYDAGYDATRLADGTPQFVEAGFCLGHAGVIYRAMLAAAPKQAEQQGVARAIALIPADAFWQVGHDGEGADPSQFKARVFDPMTMARPAEGWGDTPADAILAALNAPTGAVEKERGA